MENLTLIIPAKEEKDSLPLVLSELKNFNVKILIILKDTDTETINSIKNFDCKIIYQENYGYGDALICGINNVTTDFFCIFNADGSFNPSELTNMYNLVNKENADLVFGSRYMKNSGSDDDTIVTLIGNKVFSFLGNIFFSLRISDILYTYVMGDTKKVRKLKLSSTDFCFCVELPIKAKRFNYKILSLPSFERPRIAGEKKVNAIKDGLLILFAMIRLFFKK
jgi:glycosyltransferase involved in cell wall biosynthesis